MENSLKMFPIKYFIWETKTGDAKSITVRDHVSKEDVAAWIELDTARGGDYLKDTLKMVDGLMPVKNRPGYTEVPILERNKDLFPETLKPAQAKPDIFDCGECATGCYGKCMRAIVKEMDGKNGK